MVNNTEQAIKSLLEDTYDIPFIVKRESSYEDLSYRVAPKSEEEDLFYISLRIRNQLRVIIEVFPEKYSAFSIKDMAEATIEKKKLFAEYAELLYARKAKIDFSINRIPQKPTNPDSWPSEWNDYTIRISRSPVVNENDVFNEAEIVGSWLLIVTGMFLSLLNVVPTQSPERTEGGVKVVTQNRYERNPVNRELCLASNGYTCNICGFNFEERYGSIGHHFIHVHHIIPVSKMKEAYVIDPVSDLIPVCPNCHAMLHRADPPLQPEDLRSLLIKQ